MSERYKVAIIGAGPGGLAAGVQAAKRGVSHVLLERGELANTVHRYQKGKLVMAEPARLSIQPDLALSFEEGSREAVLQTWQDGLEAGGVNLMRGPEYDVTGLAGEKGDFSLTLRSGETLSTENVIISMGMQGNLLALSTPIQFRPRSPPPSSPSPPGSVLDGPSDTDSSRDRLDLLRMMRGLERANSPA